MRTNSERGANIYQVAAVMTVIMMFVVLGILAYGMLQADKNREDLSDELRDLGIEVTHDATIDDGVKVLIGGSCNLELDIRDLDSSPKQVAVEGSPDGVAWSVDSQLRRRLEAYCSEEGGS